MHSTLTAASGSNGRTPVCQRSAPTTRVAQIVTAVLVLALTGTGLWIRLYGLQGWDGTLTVDEARLAMAARGVVETGLPKLPSGWVYTRGLLATYLTAPSLMLLGSSDFAGGWRAGRAGAALIPVAFALGREVAGRVGGLFVAALLVGHPSFVVWSRQAWFYALYVLIFAAALLFILRAHRTGLARDQLCAGLLVGLSAFAHEAGVFLLAPLAAQVALSIWPARGEPRRWIVPLASVLIVGLAGAILWLLITRLRAESMVGAYGEIDEYLSPAVEWPRIRFYLRMLLDGPGLLAALAIVGLILAIRHRRTDTLLLWLALLPTFVHDAFLIPRGPQERYGLTLVLVIAVLAAQGARLAAEALAPLARRLSAAKMSPALIDPATITGAALAVTLLAHQDVARAIDRAALSPKEGSWLRQVRELGIGPDDLIMTDVPTTVGWYVGGLDFWLTSKEFEKYTTRTDDVRRDVHTGAALVRSRGDFDRLVARPLAGRRVWVIASGRSYQWGELVDDDLKSLLERSASERLNPGDNFRLLLLNPPSGS
jgi:4-amino-4-deoxy-L-arabinose transferase-like glycosyltransferase